MLIERENVSQNDEEGFRRWFFDDYFDLIVWFAHKDSPDIAGFQMCYDKSHFERALTWIRGEGFTHTQIDEGEDIMRNKMSPVLMPDGVFDKQHIGSLFKKAASGIDDDISAFIYEKIMNFYN